MFIGRNPGVNEDRIGRPFIGRGGELFEAWLTGLGVSREMIWLTNLIKCVAAGTYVWEAGRRYRIEDAPSSLFSGFKDTIELRACGHTLRCTPDHLVLTSSGWVQAAVAQDLMIPLGQLFTGTGGPPPSIAEVIGFMIGDGSVSKDGFHIFYCTDYDVAYEHKSHLSRYGLEPNVQDNVLSGKRRVILHRRDQKARDWLKKWDVPVAVGVEKRLPDTNGWSQEAVAALLRGLFEADGHVSREKREIQFGSISKRLVDDVQDLLRNMGIAARGYERPAKIAHQFQNGLYDMKPFWELKVTGLYANRFVRLIGFASKRKQDVSDHDRFKKTGYRHASTRASDLVELFAPGEDLYRVDVRSTEYVGRIAVYDVRNQPGGWFPAGGVVTHNCFTDADRKPKKSEINTCWDLHLKKEIAYCKPMLLVSMGAESFAATTGLTQLSQRHGILYDRRAELGAYVMGVIHPGSALRDASYKSMMVDDGYRLKPLLHYALNVGLAQGLPPEYEAQ